MPDLQELGCHVGRMQDIATFGRASDEIFGEAMLALYYYISRNPQVGDFRDLSCRPDPDFSALTLGICRPPLRKRLASLATQESIELLFYTVYPPEQTLFLTALLKVETVFETHAIAHSKLMSAKRPNLLIDGNPCTKGTVFTNGLSSTKPSAPNCDCLRYVGRSAEHYFTFQRESAIVRVANPVHMSFPTLKRLCPSFFAAHHNRTNWRSFQCATSNDCHFIINGGEQAALRTTMAAPAAHAFSAQSAIPAQLPARNAPARHK